MQPQPYWGVANQLLAHVPPAPPTCAPAPVASPTTAALLSPNPIVLVAAFSSAAAADARAADGSWPEEREGMVKALAGFAAACSGSWARAPPFALPFASDPDPVVGFDAGLGAASAARRTAARRRMPSARSSGDADA